MTTATFAAGGALATPVRASAARRVPRAAIVSREGACPAGRSRSTGGNNDSAGIGRSRVASLARARLGATSASRFASIERRGSSAGRDGPARGSIAAARAAAEDAPATSGEDGGGPPDGGDDAGSGGGGGGDGDDQSRGDGDDEEEPEEMRTLDEVTAACEAKDAKLPDDMASIAAAEGMRASVLSKYLAYVANPVLAALFAAFPAVRDRALADPTFLFKLGVEVFGDVGLSVAAEMHSRNDHFADEAEFFVADVVAGSALNAAVLTMLSPTVSFGVSPGGGRALRMLSRVDGKLNDFIRLLFCRALPPAFPASAFVPGPYPAWRRVGSLALQGVRVGGVSALVGFAGQAAANGVCRLRRKYAPGGYSEGYAGTIHPEAPPLLEPAAEWGAFMGLSGNARQQAIIGAELAMRGSARVHPAVAAAATVAMRLWNNVWGGEKFAERMRAMENEVYGVEA